MGEINNNMDIIDSRDIIARIEELERMIEGMDEQEQEDMSDEKEELKSLKDFKEQASDFSGWNYGETLIRETYFTDYVMEMLQDIGELPREIPWYIIIDEEATADNIKQDYTILDFDGVDYYYRS